MTSNDTAKKRRLTKSERSARKDKIVSFIVLFIAALFFVFPLVYMIGTSLKTTNDIELNPGGLFPAAGEWTLKHYSTFFFNENTGKADQLPFWIINSLWSSFASVGLTVIFDLMIAYAVVFLKFKGKNTLVKFLTLWMAVPGVIGTAPAYAMFASIKNTLEISGGVGGYIYAYFWIIMPGISGIFNMLLMRNFFASIPVDIIDSAKSDGASHMTIFRRIVIPLAKSTIMLIVLFSFVGAWNNLIWPQLVLAGTGQGEVNYWNTVTVGLTDWTQGKGRDMIGMAMAGSVFTMIPIVIIFIFTQNKMIDGLASTGIKM